MKEANGFRDFQHYRKTTIQTSLDNSLCTHTITLQHLIFPVATEICH